MTHVAAETITVTRRGDVGSGAVAYAQHKVAAVLAGVRGPVLGAKVVLDWHRDPALERPARADVGVNLNGTVIRARSERRTMQEAIDELQDRLRRRISTVDARRRADRHLTRHPQPVPPAPAEPTASASAIIREYAEISEALTAEEASYEMDLVDHDFFLFHDSNTGAPAVLRRVGPHSCVIDALPAALTEADARAQMDLTSEPVFYVDVDTDEARVLHRHPIGDVASIALPPLPRGAQSTHDRRSDIERVATS